MLKSTQRVISNFANTTTNDLSNYPLLSLLIATSRVKSAGIICQVRALHGRWFFDVPGLRSLLTCCWRWEFSCTQIPNCSKWWKEDPRGTASEEHSVTLLLCILNVTLCVLMPCRGSKYALLRSSVALIFDISYGVHSVTIKDGDNLEMPPPIYTRKVSMRESRLK